MDGDDSGNRDLLIDLESGTKEVINEQVVGRNADSGEELPVRVLNQVWSGFTGINDFIKGEEALSSGNVVSGSVELPHSRVEDLTLVDKVFREEENVGLLENKACADKPKKKGCKKPPRPPRPPKSPSLDMADQKLMKELSELAALKRARIERMKKRMKNTKLASSNSISNLFVLIITILFCLVIIWQGVFYCGGSNIRFDGSPEASVQTRKGLISIQFYKNVSKIAPDLSRSASPNNVVPIPALLR